jgi:arylsulfatase A-like enzyme
VDWADKAGNEKTVPSGVTLRSSPNAAGFDYFYGYTHARNIGTVIEQDRVVENVEEVETQPLLTKKIVEYLDDPTRKQKPFFLYLPLCPPHTPIAPASEFVGKSQLQGKESSYGDWMYQGDWVLGQVLDTLAKHKLADNTLILTSSDNGAAGRSYAPLRASKGSIYEGGHRVPFLARWPGKIKAGAVCDDTICLNDLMSTCAEIVGAKLPDNAGEDSISILSNLLGTAKGPVREATVHQAHNRDLAIRQGPWKLIFLANGKRELYHLQTDLSETKNVIESNTKVVKRLTDLMQNFIDNGRSTLGQPQNNEADIFLQQSGGTKSKNTMQNL